MLLLAYGTVLLAFFSCRSTAFKKGKVSLCSPTAAISANTLLKTALHPSLATPMLALNNKSHVKDWFTTPSVFCGNRLKRIKKISGYRLPRIGCLAGIALSIIASPRNAMAAVSIVSDTAILPLSAVLAPSISISTAAVAANSPVALFDLYWRYFLAGGICCAFSHGVTVPFDVVKTRIQTSSSSQSKKITGERMGLFSTAKQMVEQEGIAILLQGLGPTVTGYFVQGSLKYGLYEIFKQVVRDIANINHIEIDKLLVFMLAGGMADFIGSSVLTPFEMARIRLVANPKFALGLQDCVKKIIANEGFNALFLGLPAILLKQIPYTVVQLSSYEFLTSTVYTYLRDQGISLSGGSQLAVSAFLALIAAVLSSLASQPGDTLLSVVNASVKREKSIPTSDAQFAEGMLLDVPSADRKVSSSEILDCDDTVLEIGNKKGNSKNALFGKKHADKIVSIKPSVISEPSASSATKLLSATTVSSDPPEQTRRDEGGFQLLLSSAKEVGLQGLFTGTGARLWQVSSIVVIQLLVYDFVKQLCGIPATGM